jgi:hypothetical protein
MRSFALHRLWPSRARSKGRAWVALAYREASPGPEITVVRCEGSGDAANITHCDRGGLATLDSARSAGVFRGAYVVLMLDASQRQLLVLDRPSVPDAEVLDALRWPAAASLEKSAEDLFYDATPLPPLNDSGKSQMLLAAIERSRLAMLRDLLGRRGITLDAIDVVDMGQRNAVLLGSGAAPTAAQVTLGVCGEELLVGLVAGGELCVTRNLPLPAGFQRQSPDEGLTDRLVLHVQRAVDLFERQITRFAVAGAVIFREDLASATVSALRQVLPGQLRELSFADLAPDLPPARSDATATRLAALALLRCREATAI